MKFKRLANSVLNAAMVLIAAAAQALACPMCSASVTNAENAAEAAQTINAAILVLLIPTFVIIGGLIRLVYKYRHFYVNLRTSDSERDSQ
jgi:hypothetical protein